MGRETKFGLLVGLVFIILFGVILSSHANSLTTDHAVMPTGESQAHATRAQSLHGTVDPFVQEAPLDVGGNPAPVGPVEEPLPAPSPLAADAPPVSVTDTTVTLGYGPVVVETPGDRAAPRGVRPDGGTPVVRGPTPAPAVQPPADASRPVYVVKQGDTLSSIAHQFYGKDWPKLWQQIVDANKNTLKDPKRLLVGQKLVIPNAPASAPRTDAPKGDAPKTDAPKAGARRRRAGRPGGPRLQRHEPGCRRAPGAADGGGCPPGAARDDRAGRRRPHAAPAVHEVTDVSVVPAVPARAYAIQAGDTFNKIAAKLYGDGNKYGKLLAQKNPGVDPSHMKIGQRIVLLDGVATAAAPAAPAAPAADTVVALR